MPIFPRLRRPKAAPAQAVTPRFAPSSYAFPSSSPPPILSTYVAPTPSYDTGSSFSCDTGSSSFDCS